MEAIRLFVAVPIDSRLRGSLSSWGSRLKAIEPRCRPVKPENLHFTLKFLGDTPGADIAGISEALEGVARRHPAFTIECRGAGVFPPRGRPRVVWAGVGRGGDELSALAADVDTALQELGHERESRPFTPHLTVARIRDDGRDLAEAAAEERGSQWGILQCDRFTLMSSVLGRGGPTYSVEGTFPLGGLCR